MAKANSNRKGSKKAEQTTSKIRFFPVDTEGSMLFTVNPDIPMIDALEMTQCFVSSAQSVINEQLADRPSLFAVSYLLEMVAAGIESCVNAASKNAKVQQGA